MKSCGAGILWVAVPRFIQESLPHKYLAMALCIQLVGGQTSYYLSNVTCKILLQKSVIANQFWWLIFMVPMVSACIALSFLIYSIKLEGPSYYIYSKDVAHARKAIIETYKLRSTF